MRVILEGNDKNINEIAVKVFLHGLREEYKDQLHVAYSGKTYISKIVESWVDVTFPGDVGRASFNASWTYDEFLKSDNFEIEEAFGSYFIDEYEPSLIFIFGWSPYDFYRPARYKGIPVYRVEKHD